METTYQTEFGSSQVRSCLLGSPRSIGNESEAACRFLGAKELVKTGKAMSQGQEGVLQLMDRRLNNPENLLGDPESTKPSKLSHTETKLSGSPSLHMEDKTPGKAVESEGEHRPHTASKLK